MAGFVLSDDTSNMSPETVAALTCIRDWEQRGMLKSDAFGSPWGSPGVGNGETGETGL
jgi:hypothetical protein